jgi:ribonuclease HII
MTNKKHRVCPNFNYEKKLWRQGYDFVVGLDEVGRGPLVGPVVAAAVCFLPWSSLRGCRPKQSCYLTAVHNEQLFSTGSPRPGRLAGVRDDASLRDSKQLTANQRERWYKILTTYPDIKWGIGMVSEKIIDRINILEATKLAMKKALENLDVKAEYLLLDGNFLLGDININQKAIKRGDEKIWSCAAASIIAKVTRDRLMARYDKKYPVYGFAKHKGYGTERHFLALKQYGPCVIHRRTFAPVRTNFK